MVLGVQSMVGQLCNRNTEEGCGGQSCRALGSQEAEQEASTGEGAEKDQARTPEQVSTTHLDTPRAGLVVLIC